MSGSYGWAGTTHVQFMGLLPINIVISSVHERSIQVGYTVGKIENLLTKYMNDWSQSGVYDSQKKQYNKLHPNTKNESRIPDKTSIYR